jgi:hypothetical protein
MSEDDFVKEATHIVEMSQSQGVYQRIMGSLAAYIHSADKPEIISTFRSLGRFGEGKPNFTDLDLAAYSKQGKQIGQIFKQLGFKPDQMVNGFFGDRRLIFYSPGVRYHVDVFLSKLEFSHTVDFGERPGSGRLELDNPTITLTDLILEKLQIHEINRKDLIDLIVLFLGHDVSPVASKDRELVDGAYISKILCDDWGFYYDAIANLRKVKSFAKDLTNAGKLTDAHLSNVTQGTEKLTNIVDSGPKTKKWEARAKVGTSKPWYRQVEEVVR